RRFQVPDFPLGCFLFASLRAFESASVATPSSQRLRRGRTRQSGAFVVTAWVAPRRVKHRFQGGESPRLLPESRARPGFTPVNVRRTNAHASGRPDRTVRDLSGTGLTCAFPWPAGRPRSGFPGDGQSHGTVRDDVGLWDSAIPLRHRSSGTNAV